ncbi:hydantoinase/oxoprolinase family protein [Sphingosinicella microcystinivorans]|uniref:hydantoinase/oxoprolinase family protein n=1 Tax=Sphingosinicella microcystinivorans TaxID=335406 RepID=UPI0022F3977F|nr:hydantoinase/oxoprolinase family protein [Sphingosinicella microcystinivorans]WBX85353.1 hydantoinase/oxoprolinase family protein [Sphingosinicella microcystinivorans]
MSYTVGIDVGGTFTDFYCAHEDGGFHTAKTPTTHYDLSVGFMRGMGLLAKGLKLKLPEFLSGLSSVRYSTTVGTNALIERTGPKLGLITTAGFEDTIFIGRGRSWADGLGWQQGRDLARIEKPAPLIDPEMVVGVRERIDYAGKIVAPLSREEVLEKLQTLVDRGAQGFVVSLLWSFVNPEHEQFIKQVIEEEYPEDYLGSMPVILSSEISPKAGEYTRTMTAVVNAYIHGLMADELNKLGNELRDGGYKKPLTLVHNTGGTKKASRTRAVLTHNAGPVAGLHGAAALGGLSADGNIVFTDMGGTSFDIGLIEGGAIKAHDFIPVIDRWRTNIPAIEVKSIGAGGGSIAWINTTLGDTLEVGPQSAGSMPGPACYDKGGKEPTVTDADLVLGLYNAENYLGGEMLLDVDLAKQAIGERIAKPLGIPVEEAAWRIRRMIDARMGQEVFNEVALKGHDPRTFVLYACGGAGGAHAVGFAPFIGVGKIVVPLQSSVFGAFGASTMAIKEVWERSRSLKLFNWAEQAYLSDLAPFNDLVSELVDLATRDLKLEGFDERDMAFRLELDMRYGSQYNMTRVAAPALRLESADDVRALCDAFTARYAEVYSPEATFPAGGINVESFFLTASVAQDPFALSAETLAAPEPDANAQTETRPVYWDPADGFTDTPIYDARRLKPGNRISGPAVIESPDTTHVVAPGWTFHIDAWRNGVLERSA